MKAVGEIITLPTGERNSSISGFLIRNHGPRGNTFQALNSVSGEIILQERKVKKDILRGGKTEFVASRPTLNEQLKEVLGQKINDIRRKLETLQR